MGRHVLQTKRYRAARLIGWSLTAAVVLSGCNGLKPTDPSSVGDGTAKNDPGATHLDPSLNGGISPTSAPVGGNTTTGTPTNAASTPATGSNPGVALNTSVNSTTGVVSGPNGSDVNNALPTTIAPGVAVGGTASGGPIAVGPNGAFTYDPNSGEVYDKNNQYVRGTSFALPGEAELPASDANASVTTVDGAEVRYVDAGNSLFVDTKGLKPSTVYTGTLIWPNGTTEPQDFNSDANGGIKGVSGNFIEFPHMGFHHMTVSKDSYAAVTGQYKVELRGKADNALAQTIYFAVRKRPVVMVTNANYQEQTVTFSDQPGALYVHASGFQPNAPVSITLIHANVNRLSPMVDGQDMSSNVIDGLTGLRFRADANGNVHQPLMSWTTRDPVADDLVVVAKVYNSLPKFVLNQDTAIIDHPTFVIKNSNDYFASVNAGNSGAGGVINGTTISGDAGASQ